MFEAALTVHDVRFVEMRIVAVDLRWFFAVLLYVLLKEPALVFIKHREK